MFKNKVFQIFLGICIALVVVPLLMQLLISFDSGFPGSDDGWLGFWGGYLGAILSGIIALVVVRLQINADRQLNKEEKADNTFYYLYSLLGNRKSELTSHLTFQDLKEDIYECLLDQLKVKGIQHIKEESYIDLIISFSNVLISELNIVTDKMASDIDDPKISEEFLYYKQTEKCDNTDWEPIYAAKFKEFSRIVDGTKKIEKGKELVETNNLSPDNFDNIFECLGYLESFNNGQYVEENTDYSKFFILLAEVKKENITILDNEDIKAAVDKSFKRNFSTIGQYYKIIASIIQFIDKNMEDPEKINLYIEQLNADMSILEEILFFYYVEYTDFGKNIKEKLYNTNVFTDLKNLYYDNNPHSLDFFYEEDLNNVKKYNL